MVVCVYGSYNQQADRKSGMSELELSELEQIPAPFSVTHSHSACYLIQDNDRIRAINSRLVHESCQRRTAVQQTHELLFP